MSQSIFDGLNYVVQFKRSDGTSDWGSIAAFDLEHIATNYSELLTESHKNYWEYRVVEVKQES